MCKNYAKKNAILSLDMVKSSLVATIKLRMFEIGLTQTKVAAMLFYCIGSVTPCAFREHHRTSLGLRWAFCGNSFAKRSCERNILNYWTKRTDIPPHLGS